MTMGSDVRIGSAIFNADQGHLADAVMQLDRAGIDLFHWDVFDGYFVESLAQSPRMMQAVRHLTDKPFEVHLCVVDVKRFVPQLAKGQADLVFVPAETADLLYECVETVRQCGMSPGVSLTVGTPLSRIEGVLPFVEAVLVLGRFSGEAVGKTYYLPQAIEKISTLSQMVQRKGLQVRIEAGGSLRIETARQAIEAGADTVVFGSALHRTEKGLAERLAELRAALRNG
jgi:ribulose-phosphate 3-epimerase